MPVSMHSHFIGDFCDDDLLQSQHLNTVRDGNYPSVKPDMSRANLNLQTAPFVLVVDDDQFIGELLSELLMEAGFRVEVVYDGNAAFDVAMREAPALILTDFMMPTCDGARLARRLLAEPRTHDVPLAIMSSARPRLAGLEGVPFLPKPFDIDDVITFVQRHVRQEHIPHGEG